MEFTAEFMMGSGVNSAHFLFRVMALNERVCRSTRPGQEGRKGAARDPPLASQLALHPAWLIFRPCGSAPRKLLAAPRCCLSRRGSVWQAEGRLPQGQKRAFVVRLDGPTCVRHAARTTLR